jgi:hypothetical protein
MDEKAAVDKVGTVRYRADGTKVTVVNMDGEHDYRAVMAALKRVRSVNTDARVPANRFSWSDVKARHGEVEAASKSGDAWATAWLLIEVEVDTLRFERLGLYPTWHQPDPKKRRSENTDRFRQASRKRRHALRERAYPGADKNAELIDNPFLLYDASRWNLEEAEARELLEEAHATGFQGAVGPLVKYTKHATLQGEYARLAAEAGIGEYVLELTGKMFSDRNRQGPYGDDWLNEDQKKIHARARELCRIAGDAGCIDAYVQTGGYGSDIEKRSWFGCFALGSEAVDAALNDLHAETIYATRLSDPKAAEDARRSAEEEAEKARVYLREPAEMFYFDALSLLAQLEEAMGNREDAHQWYERASRAATCREDRDFVVAGARRTSDNPLSRLRERL